MSIKERYQVKPQARVKLADWDPSETSAFSGGKAKAEVEVAKLTRKLESLQELLYAGHKERLLVVLQGMDTSGKDGVIRHVFEGVNPQGVRVASFKVPSALELEHDYLWRIHSQMPGKGEMVIFNRSHYEDVLVVRVHNFVPPEVWGKRYDQIRNFENMLAEEGVTILKFFLHIDQDEQKERLQDRLNDPAKQWKFNTGDLKERKLWDEYMLAYEAVLEKTSTPRAPWYIVPANRKWYRDLVIGTVLVKTLEDLQLRLPEPEPGLSEIVIE
jgi:PPK2 family polyphosphate:nucleotide phosphotransferase